MKVSALKKLCIILCVIFLLQHEAVAIIRVKSSSQELEEDVSQELSPPVDDDTINYLAFKINFVYRPESKGQFEHLTNGSVLHSGDHYKIIFTPVENCYVYIFQVDSANMVYQLFPMESFGGVTVNNFNPVQAGKTYYIPAEGKSFVLDEQTGTEKIYFLTSRKRDLSIEEQYQQVLESQQTREPLKHQQNQIELLLSNKTQSRKIIEVVIAPDETKTMSWREEGQTFSVFQQRLENMCDGCVYIVTFEHQ